MALFDTIGRIGASLLDMAGTRLELAAVEIEEETGRLLSYFVLAILALLLFGIAMLLVALTIIMLFWDSYRVEAAVALALVFGGAGALVAYRLKARFEARPRFLSATLGELNKDINFVRNVGAAND
jgi:uncharacterized membrane protein YqjE